MIFLGEFIMPGSSIPAPLGIKNNDPVVDKATSTIAATPNPNTVDASTAIENDAAIEALNLAETARKAAYALKKAHPSVNFTSGRRTKDDQARAMAGNVVSNRKWIEQTYAKSQLRTDCQKWVDDNPDKKTQSEISEGLLVVLNAADEIELAKFSKHLSGEAFDVQPVDVDAESIKKTIRGLEGLSKFLDKEGGLVRWHAQF